MKIFELIKTFEFEILSQTKKLNGKVELYQNVESPKNFRINMWELDLFCLKPTFFEIEDGNVSDETLWVQRMFPVGENEFVAENSLEAIKVVLTKIEKLKKHLLGE